MNKNCARSVFLFAIALALAAVSAPVLWASVLVVLAGNPFVLFVSMIVGAPPLILSLMCFSFAQQCLPKSDAGVTTGLAPGSKGYVGAVIGLFVVAGWAFLSGLFYRNQGVASAGDWGLFGLCFVLPAMGFCAVGLLFAYAVRRRTQFSWGFCSIYGLAAFGVFFVEVALAPALAHSIGVFARPA